MNFEKARKDFDAEIAEAERLCSAPEPVSDTATISDVQEIINARLTAKFRVHDMKVEHGVLFGTRSPYFGLSQKSNR